MLKCLIVAVICIKAVFGTTCWTSDLQAVKGGDLNGLEPSLLDCAIYTEKLMKMQGYTGALDYNILDYSCYTLSVDISTMPNGLTLYGCIPRGGCPLMKNVFLSVIKRDEKASKNVHGAVCKECGLTNCNSPKYLNRTRRSIVNPTFIDTIAKKAATALGVPVVDSL